MENKGFKIVAAVLSVVLIVIIVYKCENAEEDAYNDAQTTNTEYSYEKFIADYPGSEYITDAFDALYQIELNKHSIFTLQDFADNYPNNPKLLTVIAEIKSQCSLLYGQADLENTITAWEEYKQKVPPQYYEDAEEKITTLENKIWSTDSKAWEQATLLETLTGYQKYLELYPYGSHASVADKRIIDLQVNKIFNGEHGSLPSMDKQTYGGSEYSSSIQIENQTSYTLTLLYSGSDSRRIILSAGQTRTVSLRNGDYRIAASVDTGGVQDFAGSETLDGGTYSVSYYISTTTR